MLRTLLAAVFIFNVSANAHGDEGERHIVFLLDLSRSMPDIDGKGGITPEEVAEYNREIDRVRDEATKMLELVQGQNAQVSFYSFGDLDTEASQQSQQLVPELYDTHEYLSVDEALNKVDDFFVDATRNRNDTPYDKNWTYVAASVREIVCSRLGYECSDPCGRLQSDSQKPLLTLFAVTDNGEKKGPGGGESYPLPNTSNCQKYPIQCGLNDENKIAREWLKTQKSLNLLSYTHWNLHENTVNAADPTHAVYSVSWEPLDDTTSFNLHEEAQGDQALTERTIENFNLDFRLNPEAAKPTDEWRKEHSALICDERSGTHATNVLEKRARVDMFWDVENSAPVKRAWGADGSNSLNYRFPTRDTFRTKTNETGIRPTPLLVQLTGDLKTTLFKDSQRLNTAPDAEHWIRPNRDDLCMALTSAYPNSTFILPQDLGGYANNEDYNCSEPPPLSKSGIQIVPYGNITVENSPPPAPEILEQELIFDIDDLNGIHDNPVTIHFDRWWIAHVDESRGFQVSSKEKYTEGENLNPEDRAKSVDWSLKVTAQLDGWEGGDAQQSIWTWIEPTAPEPFSLTIPSNELSDETTSGRAASGKLRFPTIPTDDQAFWKMGGDFAAGASPGEYDFKVCVEIVDATFPAQFSLSDGSAWALDGDSQDRVCTTGTVTIEERPWFSWWRIALLVLGTVILFKISVRWVYRKKFPANVIGGTNSIPISKRIESNGLMNLWHRFKASQNSGKSFGPIYYITLKGTRGEIGTPLRTAPRSAFVLGLRVMDPNTGIVAFWLAHKSGNLRLMCKGKYLTVQKTPPETGSSTELKTMVKLRFHRPNQKHEFQVRDEDGNVAKGFAPFSFTKVPDTEGKARKG